MLSSCGLMFCVLHFLIIVSIAEPGKLNRPFDNSISAVLVFGDSTVDPGNNNYVNTLFKSNFAPYGRNFVNRVPTGRFTDGRFSSIDFIGKYFVFGVIPVQKQLEYFKEYKTKLEVAIGVERTKSVISKSVFLGLREEGAGLIAVVGLPPIGCIPLVITFTSGDAWGRRPCTDALSSVALDYNQKLQNMLTDMQNSSSPIIYADIYEPLNDMIQKPSQFGFENVNAGCCGSGFVETTFLCNPRSLVCSNPSKYVFFDSVHPTEATYNHLFEALRPTVDWVIKNITAATSYPF
ncbi:hypothetical protein DH2020_032775 [Rehmannia glutinosa]|uniref:GDSL esterase/lipase n=1 Tax=Rehmannia glutinosa TaxID=99300 RepID=A0ABR0VHK6_REHGL